MEEDFVKLINQNQGILQRICNIYFYQHPYREDYYQDENPPDEANANITEVIVAKNRHGETGTVKLQWLPQFTTRRSTDCSTCSPTEPKKVPSSFGHAKICITSI